MVFRHHTINCLIQEALFARVSGAFALRKFISAGTEGNGEAQALRTSILSFVKRVQNMPRVIIGQHLKRKDATIKNAPLGWRPIPEIELISVAILSRIDAARSRS